MLPFVLNSWSVTGLDLYAKTRLTPQRWGGKLIMMRMADKAKAGDPKILGNNPNSESPRFSHPSEAEFASLLDFYGIPWQYEPHTFVLRQASPGKRGVEGRSVRSGFGGTHSEGPTGHGQHGPMVPRHGASTEV